MDYRLAAARRLLTVDAQNARALSIVSDQRPVFQVPGPAQANPQAADPAIIDPAMTNPALAHLASTLGSRVGLLEVESTPGQFIPLATAWPCAPDGPTPETRRFVTAGHVLEVFLRDNAVLRGAALPADGMRNGRVVMPGGAIFPIARWICAAPVDVAVFDVQQDAQPCPGLSRDTTGQLPAWVAPLGYPLQTGFALFGAVNPAYPGHLFCGTGESRVIARSGEASRYFLHDASTLPGYSGAPVFDPDTGRVVGVHVWGVASASDASDWNDAVRMSSMLRIPWLAAILAGQSDGLQGGEPAMAWLGGRPPVAAEYLLPRIELAGPEAGIVTDRSDARDRLYQPGLAMAQDEMMPTAGVVGDQLDEGSCAAFAVAAAIEHQLARRQGYVPPEIPGNFSASVRMLDRMARRHDEWLDDTAEGTSLRAVLKGFYQNGVCSWDKCRYVPRQADFFLTRDIARDARRLTLGSYARVDRTSVNDMRMAVQEAGAVLVTARIHAGWSAPRDGRILYDPLEPAAGSRMHAFVIDGYTDEGFIIQNSRGAGWGGFKGLPGHALWSFEDWSDNCLDAWVIRLAPRSEQAFAVSILSGNGVAAPRRIALLGHLMHAERDGLVEDGTLGLGARGLAETAAYLATGDARDRYDRLLLLFHEPLLGADQIAQLALPLTARLKARRVYPFHIAYGLDEMRACRLRLGHDIAEITARYLPEGEAGDSVLLRLLGPSIRAQVAGYRDGAGIAARASLRDALAVLPLFAGRDGDQPGLPLAMVSVGLGVVPAQVLAQTVPEFRRLPHLAIAAPVAPRSARQWTLAKDLRTDSDLPGWRGSWGDLVAAAHGRKIRSERGAMAATVQELLKRADSVPELLARLG